MQTAIKLPMKGWSSIQVRWRGSRLQEVKGGRFIFEHRLIPFVIHKNIYLDQGNGLEESQTSKQLPGESETNGAQINKLRQQLVNSHFVMLEKQQIMTTQSFLTL